VCLAGIAGRGPNMTRKAKLKKIEKEMEAKIKSDWHHKQSEDAMVEKHSSQTVKLLHYACRGIEQAESRINEDLSEELLEMLSHARQHVILVRDTLANL
jgi:hypothetical protein